MILKEQQEYLISQGEEGKAAEILRANFCRQRGSPLERIERIVDPYDLC